MCWGANSSNTNVNGYNSAYSDFHILSDPYTYSNVYPDSNRYTTFAGSAWHSDACPGTRFISGQFRSGGRIGALGKRHNYRCDIFPEW